MRGSLPLVVTVVLGAGGCRSLLGIEDVEVAIDSGMPIDSGTDAPLDAFPGCYGVDPFTLCISPSMTIFTARTLAATTISTGSDCSFFYPVNNRMWCVIAAENLTVTGAVRAVGPNPLVLLGTNTLTVAASSSINVSSQMAPGAGAELGPCESGTPGGSTAGGGGGGAGGSFGSLGGSGGAGQGGIVMGGSPGPGLDASSLRGGCAGSAGGNAGFSSGQGLGGGAVYLLGGTRLTIEGAIYASGRGGDGGVLPRGGGGGGGSGGMVVLWSPAIDADAARIVANGGGGGGGASASLSGLPGGTSMDPKEGGRGGDSGGAGPGPGGAGSAMGTAGKSGLVDAAGSGGGGGGGGGGAGVIRWLPGPPPQNAGTGISPPPT